MNYDVFAKYYDIFTQNVDYALRANYFDNLIRAYGNGGMLLVDLACGTGSLSYELAKNYGYDIIAVDESAEMLSVGMNNKRHDKIQYVVQKMENLDLFGTTDTVICALDSLNHVLSKETLQEVFRKISLFLNPNGLFIFDVNSEYKHKNILADNTFVYETENVFCCWQNSYDPKTRITEINLDFFEKTCKLYTRNSVNFAERAYLHEEILELLEKSGLTYLSSFEGDTENPIALLSERLVYVAKCQKQLPDG